MFKRFYLYFVFFLSLNGFSQDSLKFELFLKPKVISQLPALHSYAFGQHEGKWLIIGGRLDGLHARQPFNAFPASSNHQNILVVDPEQDIVYSKSILELPTGIKEQLQASNTNFYQDGTKLIIAGGYAFSASANGHITFPNLTVIDVPEIITAIINENDISAFIRQIVDERFAITGGAMGKIGEELMIVGGHRFDGRYNPMNNPTFTQAYTNEIRKFKLELSSNLIEITNYSAINDPIHLHRRDYNLVPQIYNENEEGYMISSGVFQLNADLPFLYPVEIMEDGINPRLIFNQYLSHYHSPKLTLYDENEKINQSFFFGGMSQYYYENGQLIQDDLVPFVKTISMVTRFENDSLAEYLLPIEMPALKGSSAEFIPNKLLPGFNNGVIKINQAEGDSILLGYMYGGINSNTLNPFSANQTNQTTADANVYEIIMVRRIVEEPVKVQVLPGKGTFDFIVYPNPSAGIINIEFQLPYKAQCDYFITSLDGKIIQEGSLVKTTKGKNKKQINIYSQNRSSDQTLILTLIFDNKLYASKRIIYKNK
jgi:hypothetical protein